MQTSKHRLHGYIPYQVCNTYTTQANTYTAQEGSLAFTNSQLKRITKYGRSVVHFTTQYISKSRSKFLCPNHKGHFLRFLDLE